ncbi:MAG: phenylalanine--tRNA ligase beta subunit-related protein [Anaerolineaceae bacterium]|nr:phenylalanine--tRNA ligase beta subunit-related protein [Anaerolineaceae bacterium]MCY4022733.1 phenylalanine--tRNA ligase beta subunit-related protein [Anaerolineaceae bacterium]
MSLFQYDSALLERYPETRGAIISVTGLAGGNSSPDLLELYAQEQAATLERIGDRPLSALPSIAAWRRCFSGFGVRPTQYRSAVEALLRRLTKRGDIPSINRLVDIGNLVSIRHEMPVAIFDTRELALPVTVRFADGHERFTGLGEREAQQPACGEVIFADTTDLVVARRWCWRQSAESAAQADTTEALVTCEAQHADSAVAVEQALEDLSDLLSRFAGGEARAAILDIGNPAL